MICLASSCQLLHSPESPIKKINYDWTGRTGLAMLVTHGLLATAISWATHNRSVSDVYRVGNAVVLPVGLGSHALVPDE